MAIVVDSKQYFAVPAIEIGGQIHQEPNSNQLSQLGEHSGVDVGDDYNDDDDDDDDVDYGEDIDDGGDDDDTSSPLRLLHLERYCWDRFWNL